MLLFALLVFALCPANAQTTKIKVDVDVSADDSIKSDIESYIKRELRALNDIDLYASKPDFEIQLVAIKPGSAVAISVVVLRKYDWTSYIDKTLPSKIIDTKTKNDLIKTVAISESINQHFLFSDTAYNLSDLCKTIVARVDANTFEYERQLNGLIETYLKDKPNSLSTQSKATVPPPFTQQKQDKQPVFERRYVGGNKPPQVIVTNDADVALTLNFGGSKYTVPVGQTQTINTTDGGIFSFTASAPGVESLSGEKNFERGYIYTWRFYIITVRR